MTSMTATQLKKGAEGCLKSLGFAKLRGSTYLRETGETFQISFVSVSRYEPLLLIDVGVLVADRWVQRLDEAVSNPMGWDIKARVEHVVDLGRLADALDLSKPSPDRLADLETVFNLAASQFWDPYSDLNALRAYVTEGILPPKAWSSFDAPHNTAYVVRYFST